MADRKHQTVRTPASKQPHLRKQQQKLKNIQQRQTPGRAKRSK